MRVNKTLIEIKKTCGFFKPIFFEFNCRFLFTAPRRLYYLSVNNTKLPE